MKLDILSAYEVPLDRLLSFYNEIYRSRSISIPKIWQWLYRTDFYNKKIPLVVMCQNQIVGHAGMIPFYLNSNGKKYRASWFVDFQVHPEYQRLGIGMKLTKKWMEFADVFVTFCNEKSIGVFKKYGWLESFDTNINHYFIRPFDLPKIVRNVPKILRKGGNFVTSPYYKNIYRRRIYPQQQFCMHSLNSKTLDHFLNSVHTLQDVSTPLRDEDYITWRLLNSPYKEDYRMASLGEDSPVKMILKLRKDKRESHHMDILWVSNIKEIEEVKQLLLHLLQWADKNGFAYLRHYISDKGLASKLKKALGGKAHNPRFAFYSKNNSILGKLKNTKWHFEMIDSDFEFI